MKNYKTRFPKAYKKITEFLKKELPGEVEKTLYQEVIDTSMELSPSSVFYTLDEMQIFCSVFEKNGVFYGRFEEEEQSFEKRLDADHFVFEKALIKIENEQ
jgi:hypothetical protein